MTGRLMSFLVVSLLISAASSVAWASDSGVSVCAFWLRAVGNAMHAYVADHGGSPPHSVGQLVPKYIPRVPTCPTSHQPYNYEVSGNNFTVYCHGRAHDETKENSPSFSSSKGLEYGWTREAAWKLWWIEHGAGSIAVPMVISVCLLALGIYWLKKRKKHQLNRDEPND